MPLASVGNGVFIAQGGVFHECCCHFAFMSIKRSSGGESIIVCIEDRGNEGHVEWVKEIEPDADFGGGGTITSLWWRESLFLAIRPLADDQPSIFKLNARTGDTVADRALVHLSGGARLNGQGIAVTTDGKVFVSAAASLTPGNGRDMWRLDLNLSTMDSATVGQAFLDPNLGNYFSSGGGFNNVGRQRMMALDDGQAPTVSGADGCFRINQALTLAEDFNHFKWGTHEPFGGSGGGGGAPNVHLGGPDVLIAENQSSPGELYHHIAFHANHFNESRKKLVTSVRGTFANSGSALGGAGYVWAPADTLIRKIPLTGVPYVATYIKTLGVDFLTDGTWGEETSRLDVLRHRGGDLWILARDTNPANMRAILIVFQEDITAPEPGEEWIEKWQLDLMADEDVDWSDPSTADHWRGWCLSTPGQGFHG